MDRRTFVGGALVGLTACGTEAVRAGAPATLTNKKVKWRLASSFPRSLDTIFGAAEVMSERLSQMTAGNFEIRVHPAGEIVPGLQVMDAVQQGTVQIGHTASYYYIGKNPVLAFDTCVPFGLTARQQSAWLIEAGGLELINEVYADFGIMSLPGGNTGVQMGGWFRQEVKDLADLKGLKMRIPGLGGKVMERLGVATQTLAGGEIYTALERGAIDATEWVGPYDDEKLGFYKVAKNYYYPGWWEPGPSMCFHINLAEFEALPAAYQAALKVACADAGLAMIQRYDARNPDALARILAPENGVTLRPFSEDLMAGAREASRSLLSDEAAQSPQYAKILAHWEGFRDKSFRWASRAESAYGTFAFSS